MNWYLLEVQLVSGDRPRAIKGALDLGTRSRICCVVLWETRVVVGMHRVEGESSSGEVGRGSGSGGDKVFREESSSNGIEDGGGYIRIGEGFIKDTRDGEGELVDKW